MAYENCRKVRKTFWTRCKEESKASRSPGLFRLRWLGQQLRPWSLEQKLLEQVLKHSGLDPKERWDRIAEAVPNGPRRIA